ncbi:HAD family hydrolase [Nocardioides solisilvae]|uniref:HAD family hydrolase n=1 Tax=Nocardioides solisilvae TaxID=1542435 RepID=UPI000D742A1A|nr:HAD family hydrolase [Nocardioides solisilvae]
MTNPPPTDHLPTGLPLAVDTVVLDIDGTLLDSNYHHTVAWVRAFARHGHDVPAWRIHRQIGQGGDRLVAAAAGQEVEDADGDSVRDAWEEEFDALMDETTLLPGARDLLAALHERGLKVVLASSAIPRHAAHATRLLDADDLVDAATTAEDAEETKPDPELLDTAIAKVDGGRAVLVGDSVWDVEAANARGLPTLGVLTGGFSRAELEETGAVTVVEDAAELLARLDELLQPAPPPGRHTD